VNRNMEDEMTVKVTLTAKSYLRTGGSRKGPDNRIGHNPLPPGEYEALAQSPCAEVTDGPHNYWWVRLRTPLGDGWVTAAHVATGPDNTPVPNDKPVPKVHGIAIPEVPTAFDVPGADGGPTVRVWRDTSLRMGGSTKGPDNLLAQDLLPRGEYTALAQCAGEEVRDEEHHYYNIWWVKLATDWGPGWVTAIDVATGDNYQPIPPVHGVPIPEQPTVMMV
jgi:hypothetical protein